MQRTAFFLLCLVLLTACVQEQREFPHSEPVLPLEAGKWLFSLDLGEDELPVNVIIRDESGLKLDFINAQETITAYEFTQEGDSLHIRMPLFDSEFKGVIAADRRSYDGKWYNYQKGNDYSIPFHAELGIGHRFCETNSSMPPMRFAKRFKVDFSPDSAADHYPAIGLFDRTPNSNRITGTFATETGDYRYLEGNFCDDRLNLSCFDGSHAFLFTASYRNDSLVDGVFKSGTHWTEPWHASPDSEFELRDPDLLTQVVDSAAIWDTRFYDAKGEERNLKDLHLEGKVAIIQILGSWCPNCVDESNSYRSLYQRYHERGLEIIPLAFEKEEDPLSAKITLDEFTKDLDLPYPIYYAGKKGKKNTAAAIPALDRIMSYPTSVIIARDGSIQKVHTGFYGPSTGMYYERWLQETEMLIDSLLKAS